MQIDVVNARNERVGSLDLRDEVFGGRVKADLVWQSVVHQNAGERRGTHATKTRALVSGSGRKPWRQKGTGRARVGETRNPLWRKGGIVFGPQPRDYGFPLSKKAEKGALRAALTARLGDGGVTVVEQFEAAEAKTKAAAAMLRGLGAAGRTLLIDVRPDAAFALSVRNIAGVRLVPSGRVTARDVMDAERVIATRAALERLQEVLA